MTVALLEGFAELREPERALRRMQGVVHEVARVPGQLLLDGVVLAVTRLGLHQAGIGGVDQRAEFAGGNAEALLAGGIEKQQRPTGFVQPLEAQQPQPRWRWQLRHNLGRQKACGIGMAFH